MLHRRLSMVLVLMGVLIETKKGKEGKVDVNYKFKMGMNFARKGYEYLNAGDYLYYTRLI